MNTLTSQTQGGALLQTLQPDKRWEGELVVVAAPGPSLQPAVADAISSQHVLAVQDAWRLCPFAEVMYGCDCKWWNYYKGCMDFTGERWSSHTPDSTNDKSEVALAYGLKLVAGRHGEGFGLGETIHYGGNSGFQAVNLAILFGASTILLVGFDMRQVNGKQHFFGDHPQSIGQSRTYDYFIKQFASAAESLPDTVKIYNCTQGSALSCFSEMDLTEALNFCASPS